MSDVSSFRHDISICLWITGKLIMWYGFVVHTAVEVLKNIQVPWLNAVASPYVPRVHRVDQTRLTLLKYEITTLPEYTVWIRLQSLASMADTIQISH
jgi:hypothetical protein